MAKLGFGLWESGPRACPQRRQLSTPWSLACHKFSSLVAHLLLLLAWRYILRVISLTKKRKLQVLFLEYHQTVTWVGEWDAGLFPLKQQQSLKGHREVLKSKMCGWVQILGHYLRKCQVSLVLAEGLLVCRWRKKGHAERFCLLTEILSLKMPIFVKIPPKAGSHP